ncbi:MAG: alpha/beta hydrolase [Acidobacteria bacterium]|nr:alpha/beta hydrolase [Acidobacteriota bacterium]
MTVTVDGAELYCSVHGSGPVCLVPSAIGTAPYERQMAPQLADHLTMVFFDLRGGGRSTGRAADLTFDRFAEDVDAIRGALGVDRVALLGHSILGMLVLECGRRLPDRVSHVVTVGTPPHGDMSALGARSTAFFEADADDERRQRMRGNLAALPPDPSPGQILLAQTPMRFHDPTMDAAPLFAGAVSRPELLMHLSVTLAAEWTITADPGSLTVPILLTHGRSDYTVPHTLWAGIPATLPDATFRLLEASGHQPFFEEPERFTAAVTEWIASRSAPKRRPQS